MDHVETFTIKLTPLLEKSNMSALSALRIRTFFFVPIALVAIASFAVVHGEYTCNPEGLRLDCGEIRHVTLIVYFASCTGYHGITEQDCVDRGCCWKPVTGSRAPWCFRKNSGYKYCSAATDRIDCGTLGGSLV